MTAQHRGGHIAFQRINERALLSASTILSRWLPGGRHAGTEYVATNPTRSDRRPGSFKVNTSTGKWADFATGDRGGDLIALAAYLFSISQTEAALAIAEMLGIDPREGE